MKAISSVVASVLILLITIALGGTAYLFISGTFSRTTSQVLDIQSAEDGVVRIRNLGTETISSLQLKVDNVNVEHVFYPIQPGESRDITILDRLNLGRHSIDIQAGSFRIKGIMDIYQPIFPLSGIENTVQIVKEISEGAFQDTQQYDVCGADLGNMFKWNSKTYIVFGDTFGCPLSGTPNWRSNTMATTTDTTFSNGVAFDSWILGADGKAKQLFSKDAGSVTVIPTYGIGIGSTGYIFYMEVTSWDTPGHWTCSHSSIATSSDEGQTWSKQNSVIKWDPGNFNQVSILKIDNYIYIWGIPCGRFGSVKLMKVDQNDILDKSKYQYFTDLDSLSQPVWSNSETDAATVASDPVGELSVRYNKWLGRYIMTYLDESKSAVVIRESPNPWGQWGKPIIVATASQYPALYGAYMLDEYEENNGETIYFRMSQFFPLYSTYWMKTTLKKVT